MPSAIWRFRKIKLQLGACVEFCEHVKTWIIFQNGFHPVVKFRCNFCYFRMSILHSTNTFWVKCIFKDIKIWMIFQNGFDPIVNFRAQFAFDEYFMGDANIFPSRLFDTFIGLNVC